MLRIGAVVVAVVALSVLAIGRLASGHKVAATDEEGLVMNNSGSLYFVRHSESSFALYLPGKWGSSSRSSSNSASKSWVTDVTLHATGKRDVTLQGDSKMPTQVMVNGVAFDLAVGSFLRINPGGKVEQLPFAPLPASDQTYLKQLNGYFAR